MYLNNVLTTPVTETGILDLVEADEYGIAMSRWYDESDLPGGLVESFTSIEFIQYDAFVPGLGTVQAALDNLYANL